MHVRYDRSTSAPCYREARAPCRFRQIFDEVVVDSIIDIECRQQGIRQDERRGSFFAILAPPVRVRFSRRASGTG